MHATLEYVGVALLVVALILVAQYSALVFTREVGHVMEEQLYTVAERILDKILLTPGEPPDWGWNLTSALSDFGLAAYGTRVPYDLDPDKIMRLCNLTELANPLYLNSSRLAELLALEGYGFRLEMVPFLDHRVEALENRGAPTGDVVPSSFRVAAVNQYGMGVPGANVTGIYVVVGVNETADGPRAHVAGVLVEHENTDSRGECELDFSEELEDFFSDPPPADHFLGLLIVHTNWHGFVAVDAYSSAPEGAPAGGYVIGNYVVVSREVELVPSAVVVRDEVVQAIPEYESLLLVAAVELECEGGGDDPACSAVPSSYKVYRLEYVERLSSHVVLVAEWEGRYFPLVICRIPRVEVESSAAAPANVVELVRLARLFNYPYVIRLVLWRESEG